MANETRKCGKSGARLRFELGAEKRRPRRRHVVQAGAPEKGGKGRKETRRGSLNHAGKSAYRPGHEWFKWGARARIQTPAKKFKARLNKVFQCTVYFFSEVWRALPNSNSWRPQKQNGKIIAPKAVNINAKIKPKLLNSVILIMFPKDKMERIQINMIPVIKSIKPNLPKL